MLFATAVYLFDAGDVIEDGNTISEPDGEGRYVCRRETALLDPPDRCSTSTSATRTPRGSGTGRNSLGRLVSD